MRGLRIIEKSLESHSGMDKDARVGCVGVGLLLNSGTEHYRKASSCDTPIVIDMAESR